MKKILFGITNLNIGGAEKVLVDLANELSKDEDITILTLYPKGKLEQELNKNVKIINYYKKAYNEYCKMIKVLISLEILLMKKYMYKKYIKNKYDIEIAFLEGPITNLFSVKNNKTKKIAWVHTNIAKIFGNSLNAKIKRMFNKKIYNKYSKIIFVSKSTLDVFDNIYNINKPKIIINNYINYDRIIKASEEKIPDLFSNQDINFLTVSRLIASKGIDRLIKIHSKLIKNGYYHKMYVIGDGSLKNQLVKLINGLNIQNSFILLGEKQNPYPYIKNCDYFCLMSYYEGLPTVLIEAKILNKPILITENINNESLKNYDNKIVLGNDENSIYKELTKIINTGKKINNTNTQPVFTDNKEIIEKIKAILN